MTPERKARYIEGLRLSASHRYASQYATPRGDPSSDPGQAGFAYSSFVRERKIDLEFAQQCEEALNEALGRLEKSVMKRAFRPDVRKNWDAKTGALIGESISWMASNLLARSILARHDNDWVDKSKREVSGTVNVNHNDGNGGGGASYAIRIDEVRQALTQDETLTLMNLLAKLEDFRMLQQSGQSEQSQLPSGDGESV